MRPKASAYLTVMILSLMFLSGCQANKADTAAIRSHADPVAEKMLLAFSQDNYADFASHLSQEAKARYPETDFHSWTASIRENNGTFVSLDYFNVVTRPDSVSVLYYVKFSKKGGTMSMQLDLEKADASGLVSGFYLYTPISR